MCIPSPTLNIFIVTRLCLLLLRAGGIQWHYVEHTKNKKHYLFINWVILTNNLYWLFIYIANKYIAINRGLFSFVLQFSITIPYCLISCMPSLHRKYNEIIFSLIHILKWDIGHFNYCFCFRIILLLSFIFI